MSATYGQRALEWLLEPWLRGSGLRARAARVGAVALGITLPVLPAMISYYGPDGWWWDNTLSVCLLAPVGIIVADELAERLGALAQRRVHGMRRVLVLALGLIAGIAAGYWLTFALHRAPERTARMLVADFQRTLGILTPILCLLVILGTSLWHRAEAYRLETAAAQASFRVLQQQMQPHFLFNALNALKELIQDDPALACDFTQRLADLYRMILEVSRDATAPLAHELSIVRHYLEVERFRYGARLRYQIDAPNELAGLHVPTLMLQTLAENAVKHGIGKSRTGGEVWIRAARSRQGGLELEVSNTGAPYAPAPLGSAAPATGLSNTRARLQLMYGAQGALSISSDPERGTCVRCVVSGERLG